MAKRLTNLDKDFINENYQTMTDAKIAEVLNCSVRTIERYRQKNGYFKTEAKQTEKVEQSNYSDEANYFKSKLVSTSRGRRVKDLISKDEWSLFVDEWVNYHVQLEDLTFTEENTVEQIIILKLRMDRNQKEYKDCSLVRDSLLDEANVSDIKDLDLKDPVQAEYYEKIYTASIRMTDFNKEYKELLDKSTKLQETLNATRKQREDSGRVGADTFFSLCKKFEQKSYREKESRMAELLKISAESNANNLRDAIEYMDGEIAPQLLDSDTVEKMEEEK